MPQVVTETSLPLKPQCTLCHVTGVGREGETLAIKAACRVTLLPVVPECINGRRALAEYPEYCRSRASFSSREERLLPSQ